MDTFHIVIFSIAFIVFTCCSVLKSAHIMYLKTRAVDKLQLMQQLMNTEYSYVTVLNKTKVQ